MVVKENCFNMTNTICICPMGTWLHSGTQQCIPCTHPKMGQIYLKPCLQFEDAVVAYCPLVRKPIFYSTMTWAVKSRAGPRVIESYWCFGRFFKRKR